jgi:lysophospholipid acyltransferase (LPLAT)-like uncharacterized protein
MNPLYLPFEAWGRQIAHYSMWAVRSGQVVFDGEFDTRQSHITISWHGFNMLALAVHAVHRPRPRSYFAFAPPGLVGATMRGWLRGVGVEPVPLPADAIGNPAAALKHMARALKDGLDVGIALDGPHGPARQVRPGALWLARVSGCPLLPMSFAARPALRFPRWDRHLIPLRGARIVCVYGDPIRLDRREELNTTLFARIADVLSDLERRAWEILDSASPAVPITPSEKAYE